MTLYLIHFLSSNSWQQQIPGQILFICDCGSLNLCTITQRGSCLEYDNAFVFIAACCHGEKPTAKASLAWPQQYEEEAHYRNCSWFLLAEEVYNKGSRRNWRPSAQNIVIRKKCSQVFSTKRPCSVYWLALPERVSLWLNESHRISTARWKKTRERKGRKEECLP